MIGQVTSTQMHEVVVHTTFLNGCGQRGEGIFETKIVCPEDSEETKIFYGYSIVTYDKEKSMIEHESTVYLVKFIFGLMGKNCV